MTEVQTLVKQLADTGSQQMERMNIAMGEIEGSSQQISKIIKT